MAEQYQIMAIDSRDSQTNPKTEEQKPEPQKSKGEIVCPAPTTNKINMKKSSGKTVSQFTKSKKSNSKSLNLDQNGQDIGSEKQQIDSFSIKPKPDKENSTQITKNEVKNQNFTSNAEESLENSSISDWEHHYDCNQAQYADDNFSQNVNFNDLKEPFESMDTKGIANSIKTKSSNGASNQKDSFRNIKASKVKKWKSISNQPQLDYDDCNQNRKEDLEKSSHPEESSNFYSFPITVYCKKISDSDLKPNQNESLNSDSEYFYDCVQNEALEKPSTPKGRSQFHIAEEKNYKKFRKSNHLETKPIKLGYTTQNNVEKIELQNMRNSDLDNFGPTPRSGSDLGYNRDSSKNPQINNVRTPIPQEKQYGYMSICLIFCNDRKQHCILSTRSMESFIPQHLLKFIDPNCELPSYYVREREKLKLKFDALDKQGKKASLQFDFTINNKIKYPILGVDFVRSTYFQSLHKDNMVLQTSQGMYQIPTYLSLAPNRWRTGAHREFN